MMYKVGGFGVLDSPETWYLLISIPGLIDAI